ncbi:MAG: NAD(P)-dependent oxidoreductase, partial [Myxococcota bacterium]|nr:NAD(P)-dependent oxidoreductase [Myxococcota bacterium]
TIVSEATNCDFHYSRGPLRRALVLENPDPVLDELLEGMGIAVERINDAPGEDELVNLLQSGGHDLIFKRSKVEINERIVSASPNLAAVMLCCIGDDTVDKQACADRGVMVMNDPVSNGRSVAELVIGELISLSRRLFDSVPEMAQSVWQKDSVARYELMGKKVGILGLGAIGRQVAQLARAMGMEVFFFDSAVVPREVGLAMGWTACDSIADLCRACDYVTVHLSATDSTGTSNQNVITYEALAAMGDKDYESPRIFINLARGFHLAPESLLRAVQDGHITYAMTDVFPEEPRPSQSGLWQNPYEGERRIFATPHIGAATREAQPRIARYVARTTQLFSEYGMLRNCVFRPRAAMQFELEFAKSILSVVHVDTRGTKKAVDDAIYEAGANNLRSAHMDFPGLGMAYDLSALDRNLDEHQARELAQAAARMTGDPNAVRSVRAIPLDTETTAS